MKSLLTASFALLASGFLSAQTPARAGAPAAAPPPPPTPVTSVIVIDHTKTAEAFAKGGTLVNAPDMLVQGSHREVPGHVEVHDKETDILYMISGGATFVTGGKMVGGKLTRPGQWAGDDITGGQTHQLQPGDIVVVPAGTPHWFKQVSPQISYYVVKVVKP
jgi:mannose-6-phosphate isomerase-like protein (cupin superfamily)